MLCINPKILPGNPKPPIFLDISIYTPMEASRPRLCHAQLMALSYRTAFVSRIARFETKIETRMCTERTREKGANPQKEQNSESCCEVSSLRSTC